MSFPVISSRSPSVSLSARTPTQAGDLGAQLTRLAEVARGLSSAAVLALAELRWELGGRPQVGECGIAALPDHMATVQAIDCEVLARLLASRSPRGMGTVLRLSEAEVAGLLGLPGQGVLVPVEEHMPAAVVLMIGGQAGALPDAFLAAVGDTIALHRRAQAWKESADSSREAANRFQWLLSLSADAVWDADAAGRIHSVRPLGDRLSREAQQAMLRHNALHIDGHGPLAGVFAELNMVCGVQAHIHTGTEKIACRVSAQRVNGAIRGVVTVVEGPDAVRQRQNLLGIIQRLNRVRERERDLRLEAETLLQGLRILTGGAPSHRMFADLLELLRMPLGFEAACVVRRLRNGRLEPMPGADSALAACDWAAVAGRLEEAGGDPAVLVPDDEIAACLGDHWRSIVVAPLEVDHDAAWLVGFHSDPDMFRPRQLGLLSRLVLLANQALASEEQRSLLLHSSKLASLGEMVASLAHEINQPLGTIALAAQNLTAHLDRSEVDRPALIGKTARIAAQVERVRAITHRMRDFARKGIRRHSPFPLHHHVAAAADLVEGRLRRYGIQVVYQGNDVAGEVMGDAEQFEQVVVNILANAADAIADRRAILQGEELMDEPLITVSYHAGEDGMVEVRVRDTGIGFGADALAHALEPFFTTKEAGKGTGLGLAVSNSIIRDMEGWLRPSNWEGGAEVTIALRSADRS